MTNAYHKKELKPAILKTAIQFVEENGYQSISTRKIAQELEVSSAAVYRHFQSIDDLFNQVIEQLSQILSTALTQQITENMCAKERLKQMAANFVQFSLKEKNIFNLLFLSPYSQKDIFTKKNERLPGVLVFKTLVEQLIIENNLSTDVNTLFIQLWSFILGYAMVIRDSHIVFNQQLILNTINQLI